MSESDESGGGGDSGASKIVAVAAAFAAAFIARKALAFGWTKVTGKEPPPSRTPMSGGPRRWAGRW